MMRALQPADRSEPDLIDRIANALPEAVRADYYRELRHCRSLPENDEMLRILRAMQFLTLLTQQAPERMAAERQQLDRRLDETKEALEKWVEAGEAYQRELEERLTDLPNAIAKGMSPEAIASSINENLRQQFVRSTIPQIADSLAAVAREMKSVAAEFARRASSLGDSYTGSAEQARRAIERLESTVSGAADAGKRAADNLSWTFSKAYRWSLHSLCAISLALGFLFGMAAERWIEAPNGSDSRAVSTPQR